jgi:hypothetical protein
MGLELEIWLLALGFRVKGLRVRIHGLGFGILSFGCWVLSLSFSFWL